MKVRVEINSGAAKELLSSGATRDLVSDHAQAIAQRAGRGYRHDVWQGTTRVIASAYTGDFRSMRREAQSHNLLRALRG